MYVFCIRCKGSLLKHKPGGDLADLIRHTLQACAKGIIVLIIEIFCTFFSAPKLTAQPPRSAVSRLHNPLLTRLHEGDEHLQLVDIKEKKRMRATRIKVDNEYQQLLEVILSGFILMLNVYSIFNVHRTTSRPVMCSV
jgi:hypothetical protein